MKPINEYNFRDVCEKYVKMETPDNVKEILNNPDYVIAVCYIDSEAGVTFQVLGTIKDDIIAENPAISVTLKYDPSYILEPIIDGVSSSMIAIGSKIIANSRNVETNAQIALRYMEVLDPYRKDNKFPDDIFVPVIENLALIEKGIWVKPIDIEDGIIIATALENSNILNVGEIVLVCPTEDGFVGLPFDLFTILFTGGNE